MKEKFYRILAKVRNFIRGNTLIYSLLWFLQMKKKIFFVNSKTDLCVEGFPRSANSFLTQLLRLLCPHLKVGHHTHSIVNLKLGIKNKIPVFIIIRNPIDAITSQIIRMNELKSNNRFKNITYAISDYKQFYEFVLKNNNHLVIINFDEVIHSPKIFMKIVRDNSNIDMPNLNNINFKWATEEALNRITKSHFRISSIPDIRRDKHKNEIKIMIENDYAGESNELIKLYNMIKT